MSVPLTKAAILKKLETVYWRALNGGNWSVALRAAELQGKALGLFEKQLLPKVVRIADMTEEELTEFIDRLEKQDPTLKDQGGEECFPEKEADGKNADLESLILQEEAMPAGGGGDEDITAPEKPVSATHHAIAERRDAGIRDSYDPYSDKKNPANKFVLEPPHPEWEKPPPLI